MSAMLAPLLLLLACGSDPEPVEPACAHSVDAWFGGPSRHLSQARADGLIDLQADEAWVHRVEGHRDRHGSSFVIDVGYVQDYFLQTTVQTGNGWLAPSGDYALTWTETTVDALGELARGSVDERRTGCAVERVAHSEGARVTTLAWIVDDDTVTGTITSTASAFDVTATWRSDHSASQSYAGHDGESWYEVEEPGDGTREASFHLAYDGYTEDGGYVRTIGGDREYDFDRVHDSGEWVVMHIWWLLRYDGSGEGEVVGEAEDGSSLTCWYEWDADGVGSYSCDDGTSGPY